MTNKGHMEPKLKLLLGALALAALVLLSGHTGNIRGGGVGAGPLANPGVAFDEMPAEVSPGHDFTFTLTFQNTGTGPGYNPYI